MASTKAKLTGKHSSNVNDHSGNTWEIMKPFVHFGLKAIGLIAGTLLIIIKNIPKHDKAVEPDNRNRIIKYKHSCKNQL